MVAEQVGTVEEDHAVVIVGHDISAGIVSLAEYIELNILARIVADDAVERRIAEVLAAVSVLGKAGAFSVDKLGRYFAGQKSNFNVLAYLKIADFGRCVESLVLVVIYLVADESRLADCLDNGVGYLDQNFLVSDVEYGLNSRLFDGLPVLIPDAYFAKFLLLLLVGKLGVVLYRLGGIGIEFVVREPVARALISSLVMVRATTILPSSLP